MQLRIERGYRIRNHDSGKTVMKGLACGFLDTDLGYRAGNDQGADTEVAQAVVQGGAVKGTIAVFSTIRSPASGRSSSMISVQSNVAPASG